jgi:hypothetical protein
VRRRSAAIVIPIAIAGGAVADPGPKPIDPVAVVGSYRVTARWSAACTAPGNATATVALRPVDSLLELDLGALRDGLPALAVDGDAGSVSGRVADLAATLAWRDRGRATLAIDFDTGCTVRATARRDASGLAGCDELLALARIEAGCAAIPAADRRADVAAIERERATWKARKKKLDAACRTRAVPVRAAVETAGCLALPAERVPRSVAVCHDLASLLRRLSSCKSMPARERMSIGAIIDRVDAHLRQSVDPDQADAHALFCSDAMARFVELGQRVGCS